LNGMNISNKVIFCPYLDLMQRFAPKDENDSNCIRKLSDIKDFLERYLPDDFTYLDARDIDIGAKTQAALALGLVGEGRAYMVKQTVYDGTNTGKVFRCGLEGLEQEFFLVESKEPFKPEFYFDAEEKVAGVLKTYRFDSNAQKLVLEGEYLLKPEELAQYCLGIGELHLYSLDEARKKEEVPVALELLAAG